MGGSADRPEPAHRDTVAEHYAGLGVASGVAARVWPGARTVFLSESNQLAQDCLRSCHPGCPLHPDAHDPTVADAFPARVWLLTAGFPCEPHSSLVAVCEANVHRNVDGLRRALAPLARGAADLVVLENTPGILRLGFDLVCHMLPTTYPLYAWNVGLLDPCVHTNDPVARLRVFWVGIMRCIRVDARDGQPDAPLPTVYPRCRSTLYASAGT